MRVLQICNKKGLHARASAKFVQTVERFDADVRVTRAGETVGGTSIMGLMMLAAGPAPPSRSRPPVPKPPGDRGAGGAGERTLHRRGMITVGPVRATSRFRRHSLNDRAKRLYKDYLYIVVAARRAALL